jgi:hypothetical protein
MMPVRCTTCGRSNLPVVPGSTGGNGTISYAVAHVNSGNEPCFAGVTREALAAACEHDAIVEWKRMLWSDETFWEI